MLQWSSCLLHGTFFSSVFTTSHLERKKDIALKMKWFSFENFAQQVFMFPWVEFPPISHLVRPFCAASVSTCGVKWQSWRKFCLHYACRFFLSFGFFFHSFAFFFFHLSVHFLCRCFGCSAKCVSRAVSRSHFTLSDRISFKYIQSVHRVCLSFWSSCKWIICCSPWFFFSANCLFFVFKLKWSYLVQCFLEMILWLNTSSIICLRHYSKRKSQSIDCFIHKLCEFE